MAITHEMLPLAQQRRYDRLLNKNAEAPLTEREQETLVFRHTYNEG